MKSYKFNKCLDIIRKGNPRGIEDIYYAYFEKIKYTSLTLLKDPHAAEDIASMVLKYILEKANDIPFIENPDSWVFTVSRNFSVNYIRKNSRTISLEGLADTIPAQNGNEILRSSFMNCFLQLTEIEQNILVLHYLYGYKYKEISQVFLKIPIGTIKSSVSIIKSKLEHLKIFL